MGALLVAPPDVEREGADRRLARFAPVPRHRLPFASFLAASENDDYCSLRVARGLASDWGSTFAYPGSIGHINADSGIEDWPFGQVLLAQLVREHRHRQAEYDGAGEERRKRAGVRLASQSWGQIANMQELAR